MQAVAVYRTSNRKERRVSDYWKAPAIAFPTLDKVLSLVYEGRYHASSVNKSFPKLFLLFSHKVYLPVMDKTSHLREAWPTSEEGAGLSHQKDLIKSVSAATTKLTPNSKAGWPAEPP